MKFLSLTKTEVITILLGIVISCLELLCIVTVPFIMPFVFLMPSLGMIIYAVLWSIIGLHTGFMPDRYWEWYVKGYNRFKVEIGMWAVLLCYTVFLIYVYGNDMKNYYLEELRHHKVEEANS